MTEQALAGYACVVVKSAHFVGRVAFGQDGHVDAMLRVAAPVQVLVGGDMAVAFGMYQDVLRVYHMAHAGAGIAVVVVESDFQQHRLFGEGEQERVLKPLARALRFVGFEPLLE